MKDYYRILQVHPEAEKEVITAAYRRLIRKYHPDALKPDKREDPALLQKVLELNEAYEILGDEEKRHKYDEELNQNRKRYKSNFAPNKKLEKRLHLIRCGKTKRTFKMHLARTQGSKSPFLVLGFELIEDFPLIGHSGIKQNNFWRRIFDAVFKKQELAVNGAIETRTHSSSLSERDLMKLFSDAATLTMGDINWNGYACPDCGSVVENANGTLATWVGCSTCGHIKCAGSVEITRNVKYSECPWCGKKNKVTRSVPLGKKDHLSLKGKMGTSTFVNMSKKTDVLDFETGKKLNNGNNNK